MLEPRSIPPTKILFSADDRKEIGERIAKILESGKLTLGPYAEEMEDRFARLCGTKFAVAVGSGTASLEIVLRSKGVTGGTVLVPTNTFFATPAAVRHAGARVKFVDQDPRTLAPSLEQLKKARDPETRAVIVVHIGGTLSPELPSIRAWCDREGLFLLEDAAHAHASTLDGRAAGSFGHAASFSFYPTKVMTSGEGGMIVTDDEGLAVDARRYRDQGKESFTVNLHTRLGYNWRMSEIHAAIGLQQLQRLPEFLEGRRRAARNLREALSGLKKLAPFADPPGVISNFYKFMAVLATRLDRKKFKEALRERGVLCAGEVYEFPCHRQPVFEGDPGCSGGPFPHAEEFCDRHVCLPVYPDMTDAEVDRIAREVRTVLEES